MNLIDKDALIESLGIETDCYDCEHERMKYHCDLDPVEACTKIVEAPVIIVTAESAQKAIEVLKNAAWLGAVYSFEETEEAVKTAIRALQVTSAQPETNCSEFPNNSDTISRQAAIERLREFANDDMTSTEKAIGADYCVDLISTMPSAQPNVHDSVKDADCISRADAIDAISKIKRTDNWQAAVSMALLDLPSAQPEPDEWCTDCKEYDKDRHCCPRWNKVIRETLKDAQPEIIRCKDCKYNVSSHKCLQPDSFFLVTADDFYCGYAEKRTDGTEDTD